MRRILSLLLGFLVFNLFCQKNETDSMAINKVDSLIKECNRLLYSKTDSSKILAEMALAISNQGNYRMGIANSFNILGVVYDLQGDFGKSFSYHKQAIDVYKELSNGRGIANSQANMAILLKQNQRYGEALSYLNESSEYYISVNDTLRASTSLLSIGNLMLELGVGLDSVTRKYDLAEKGLRALNDTSTICSVLNARADANARFGNNREAIEFFEEAILLAKKANKPWNLGYSYTGLSNLYLKLNQLDLADKMNEEGIRQHRITGHTYGVMELLETKVRINEKRDDLRKAIHYLRLYHETKDSIYSEKQSKQLSQLKVQFETEKKEAEIASLSQQASIQAFEIRQKNQAIIIGVVAVLFISAVIYFFYKQRETRNQQSQTELEQRFLRSQLNPHFISNALVAVQSFMLKNDSESAALYLTKFSKLMREILENSRREYISVEEEINMLKNYLDINQQRLASFEYSIEVDEAIDAEIDTIPPMFVQPFIENAVEHGIGNLSKGGKIELIFKKSGDFITISVRDNGGGLKVQEETNHKSLSTTIIKERMDIFNRTLKKKIQLVINNLKNENGEVSGTKVELKVPFGYV